MGLKGKIRQWIQDAKTVWLSQGASRPFTRRGMTEADLLEGYKRSRENKEEAPEQADRPQSGKKHHHK